MKYVLDASVAIKWVIPEKDSDKAAELRAAHASRLHELLAPDVFPAEIAHALTKSERRGAIEPGEAKSRLALVLRTRLFLHPYLPLLQRAVEIATSIRMGVWDCLYIALAEKEQCELVTADERLLKNVGAKFPVKHLSELI
ncbi:MAG TPA: type II toxin-antitoxin system VapC family toxin [Caulifigura sp.]|nr:type II toxin-antitoxin system VapC family toxin [Caulifigura sp.]